MIDIKNKKDCCGCSACAQICPKQCIQMKIDNEGFEYPHVNKSECVDCGLCNRVCPFINDNTGHKPLQVYASKNLNETIRLRSSSGGVFSAIAEQIINNSGVVFGVTFDENWNTVHSYTETLDGLAAFRGSKYVQSKIGTSYIEVKRFLNEGRKVLFSGTPCQIAGLRKFLLKDYNNLITIEILCHGVPSHKVWQKYLDIKKQEYSCNEITHIDFRNKNTGWRRYNLSIEFNNGKIYECTHKKDPYLRGFIKNIYLRPSCYSCKCKNGRANSDIVIADYWNINKVRPDYNDRLGISLVLINTENGVSLFESISEQIDYIKTGYEECMGKNGGFKEKVAIHKGRERFFKLIMQNSSGNTFPVRLGFIGKIKDLLKI